MNLQLTATCIIVAAAVIWFVRAIFFRKHGGGESCGHRSDCPGCGNGDERCKNCNKHGKKR